ncbi:hypothetical protein Xenpb_00136 [Xenorhabdus sp. PB62.4]|nr:hypothetical protein [Xenorhabdus sp. PB62.4]
MTLIAESHLININTMLFWGEKKDFYDGDISGALLAPEIIFSNVRLIKLQDHAAKQKAECDSQDNGNGSRNKEWVIEDKTPNTRGSCIIHLHRRN